MNHASQEEGRIKSHSIRLYHELILLVIIATKHEILHTHTLAPLMKN